MCYYKLHLTAGSRASLPKLLVQLYLTRCQYKTTHAPPGVGESSQKQITNSTWRHRQVSNNRDEVDSGTEVFSKHME